MYITKLLSNKQRISKKESFLIGFQINKYINNNKGNKRSEGRQNVLVFSYELKRASGEGRHPHVIVKAYIIIHFTY